MVSIAEHFQVSRRMIHLIATGKSWVHVTKGSIEHGVAAHLRTGSDKPTAKLSDEKVKEIRHLYAEGKRSELIQF